MQHTQDQVHPRSTVGNKSIDVVSCFMFYMTSQICHQMEATQSNMTTHSFCVDTASCLGGAVPSFTWRRQEPVPKMGEHSFSHPDPSKPSPADSPVLSKEMAGSLNHQTGTHTHATACNRWILFAAQWNLHGVLPLARLAWRKGGSRSLHRPKEAASANKALTILDWRIGDRISVPS